MKRIILTLSILGVTAVALLTLVIQKGQAAPTATTYYVCDCQTNADGDCVAGNDANAGTDPASPWQTYSQARSFFNSSITAGDEIRFCQGGTFDLGASAQWVGSNCSAAQPCLISDYVAPWASGDEQRPILWKTSDGHAFDLSDNGDAEHEEGYTFQNLDIRCTACSSAGWAFFLYNDVNDLLIDNVSMDGFGIGVHLAGSNACAVGDANCNGINDRITIRNVSIVNSIGQGILGGGDDLLIENSYFENNGTIATFDHNLYISSGNRVTVRNNELYRAALDGNGSCSAASFVAHGTISNFLIEGNYVHEDVGKANNNCWGIAITPAYAEGETFTNVTIRGNRVENVGNVAIGTASCLDCTIENNVVVQSQGFGTRAIIIPAQAPQLGDAISNNLMVRNNSILTNVGSGITVNEGSGHTVVSNAIQAIGNDAGWDCLDLTLSVSSYDVIDYNICDFSAGEWANGVGNLAVWQGQGWGANSQTADPGFMSNSNLMPGVETAVLIQAGHPTLSSPTDFNGGARPAPPSAGAYEWLELSEKVYLPLAAR